MSLNDRPEVRDCFKWCRLDVVDLTYSISGGKATRARELFISMPLP
jgi:hypothetical protein